MSDNYMSNDNATTILTAYANAIKENENVQSDWNESDNSKDDYIKNKPTLGTAAAKNVPASGDASATEVVMGDDSRLTDARNAADVYSWAKASTKPSYNASEVGAIASTEKGANNGVAELDSAGKVLSSQLPSYVDDVLEYASTSYFPATGESGKIYIAIDTNLSYRWTGSDYAVISPSLALGETSSTAYRGDRGKAAYDHSQLTSGNPHNVSKSDVGLGNVPNVTTDNQTPTVTEASTRANLATGDTLKTIIGKIKKYFTDLKTVAFTGSYNDLSDKPTIPTDTNNRRSFYGTCDTAADVSAKIVTLTDTTGWELSAGTAVVVMFSNTNTAANVTLNVNGSGDKSIYFKNGEVTTDQQYVTGDANNPVLYVYDGTRWQYITYGGIQSVNNVYQRELTSADYENSFPILMSSSDATSSANRQTVKKSAYLKFTNLTNKGSVTYRNGLFIAPNIRSSGKIEADEITGINGTPLIIEGVSVGSDPKFTDTHKSFYGTCDTAAATADKVVTLANTDGWELKAGTIVGVKFTNTNSASNVTLNVNGSGAKSIYYNTSVFTSNWTDVGGYANRIIYYMYDGTYWVYAGCSNYSENKVSQKAVTNNNDDYRVLLAWTPNDTDTTEHTRKNAYFKYNPSTKDLMVPKINGVTMTSSSSAANNVISSTVQQILVVSSLPSDASSHPEILYLVGGS